MQQVEFTPALEQTLRDQVIDADQPGTVLRDFRMILDFVGPKGVKAAGKYNLLPMGKIGELNERLSRPLHLDMKRPQLRSHPYLEGLHLLLRSSGLSRVQGTGDKARLVIDLEILARWDRLNPTEQYFTLLEAWLRFGRPEMVGEQGGALSDDMLWECLRTWGRVPANGVTFQTDKPQASSIFLMRPDFYQLALMDLFGLLKVEHPQKPVQSWSPVGLKHVPYGDAVFALLAKKAVPAWMGGELEVKDEEEEEGEETEAESGFGEWQPLFQPYFPEWRENLTFPETETREGTFILKVALGDIWRRIAIRADDTLEDLVDWILRSVKFDSDHLYEFIFRDRFGAEARVAHPAMDEGPFTDEIAIGDLPLEVGQSMTLVYDFGDDWKFNVLLENIEPPSVKIKAPRILEGHGKPPEQYPTWEE